MNKYKLYTLIALILAFVVACNDAKTSPVNVEDNEVIIQNLNIVEDLREISSLIDTANYTDLRENFDQFSADIFALVQEKFNDENIMISPISLSIALSILANGADGETLNEIYDGLRFTNLSPMEVNSYMYYLQNVLTSNELLTLNIANSMWQNSDISLKRTFVDLSYRYFDAEIHPLTTAEPINKWVVEKTNGKIEEIIDEVEDDMVLFILNAVYFNADWKDKFDESLTQTEVFYSPAGEVEVDFMKKTNEKMSYKRGSFYEAVKLPYKDENTFLYAFLPKEDLDINDFFAKVKTGEDNGYYSFEPNHDRFEFDEVFVESSASIYSNFNEFDNVTIKLPKFKLEFEDERMNNVLSDMGMPSIFTGAADLSNLTEDNLRLYVEKVIHKTYIDVNEEGTEAAAVTGIDVRVTSVGLELYLDVDFNRPFFYVIRDEQAGVNLFMGQVVEPEYE